VENHSYPKIVAMAFMLMISFLSFLIIRPFVVALFSAGALAFIFYPLYKMLAGKFKKNTIAGLLTCLIATLVVLFPIIFITSIVTFELKNGYFFVQKFITDPNWALPEIPYSFSRIFGDSFELRNLLGGVLQQSFSWMQNVIKMVPDLMLNIFVTIFSTYYFLKHGKDLYKFFKGLFPLPEKKYDEMLGRVDDLTRSMILGQIVVGSAQGILAWIGFSLLHVPNPALWGFLTAIISIIPLLGAVIIWLPIDIYLFVVGYFSGDYTRALMLLAYGTCVISFIDNILKPKIVGDKAQIHPLIILLGILGGIQLFGVIGIIIGPLILTFFDIAILTYRDSL